MRVQWCLLVLMTLPFLRVTHVHAELVVTYIAGELSRDNYIPDILQIALEKTQTKYGSFKLVQATDMSPMTDGRRIVALQQNTHSNLVLPFGFGEQLTLSGELTYIKFPVDLGALGWRVCFVSAQAKEKIKAAKTLDDLRKFSMVQGRDWADNSILRENHFRVIELNDYVSLFRMVISGRADLFCRGVSELQSDYLAYKDVGNLTYDESFLLTYKIPVFFYINSKNTLAKQRIEEGLKLGYKDGSVIRAWRKRFGQSVLFSNIKQRKVFHLENSAIKNLPNDYEIYNADPFKLATSLNE